MKKILFIALFAIGLTTTTQAQCLYANTAGGDFYLSGYGTNSFYAPLQFGNGTVAFTVYSYIPGGAVTVDGVWYYNNGTDADMGDYGTWGMGVVYDADGYEYNYTFFRDSNGYINEVDVCRN